ncbi:MAG: DUF3142 domain-containing protein [Deltaproteobacteria bacterium]|nr:DUF3142 domain-containing protein [Deltaproteobacteria bacterium]
MKARLFGMLIGWTLAAWVSGTAGAVSGAEASFGQWIWSARDAAVFAKTKAAVPDLIPSPWIATLSFAEGRLEARRALSPALAGASPIAAVVRLDESFHRAWEALPAPELAASLETALSDLERRAAAAGTEILEWQLDYDCPQRRLGEWAEVLRRLQSGARRDRRLWITSLISHLQDPDFGKRLQGIVAGHILQVFDTGGLPEGLAAQDLAAQLKTHALPFRLGLGAFERGKAYETKTEHRLWFSALPDFAANPWYRGLWVFPAGKSWAHLLPSLERRP